MKELSDFKWMTLQQVITYISKFCIMYGDKTASEILDYHRYDIEETKKMFIDAISLSVSDHSKDRAKSLELHENIYHQAMGRYNKIVTDCRKTLPVLLARRQIFALGLDDARSLTPTPIYHEQWNFLDIDFDNNTASGHGLFYAGLRFLPLNELGDEGINAFCRAIERKVLQDKEEKRSKEADTTKTQGPIEVRIIEPVSVIVETPFPPVIPPARHEQEFTPLVASISNNPPVETPQERATRLVVWLQEEINDKGFRGATTRVAKREGISRQRAEEILKSVQEGKELMQQRQKFHL